MFEMHDKLRESKYLKPHLLWDVPKKEHVKEYYDDNEMTE